MTVVPGLVSGSPVLSRDDGLIHIVRRNLGVRVGLRCQVSTEFAQFKRLKKLPAGVPTCLACVVAGNGW
jgi:hypothetical protein